MKKREGERERERERKRERENGECGRSRVLIDASRDTYSLPKLTRTAEVDYFYRASLRIAQKDVLGFQITVNDVQFRRRQEQEGSTQLLRKLSRQVQRHTAEICISK